MATGRGGGSQGRGFHLDPLERYIAATGTACGGRRGGGFGGGGARGGARAAGTPPGLTGPGGRGCAPPRLPASQIGHLQWRKIRDVGAGVASGAAQELPEQDRHGTRRRTQGKIELKELWPAQ